MKLVDLTHPINNQTPVYPGDPAVKIETSSTIPQDGFNDNLLVFGTHVGTHIDAPAHMISGGKQLKDYRAERFVVPAVCIDVSQGFLADSIEIAGIRPGMGVLFYTGASARYHEASYWDKYEVMPEDCLQMLIKLGAAIVGVDTASVDDQEGFPVHKALLGADTLIIENLTNLKELAGHKFDLMALPLKLELDGAPARVMASH